MASKIAKFWFSKSFFSDKNRLNLSDFFSLKHIGLGAQLLLKDGFCKKLLLYKWTSEQLNTYFIKIRFALKAYVSEEILSCHSLCLSLNTDLCIHFYWLCQLRQANHRKMIQISALRLRLWLCHFKISSDTPALSPQSNFDKKVFNCSKVHS